MLLNFIRFTCVCVCIIVCARGGCACTQNGESKQKKRGGDWNIPCRELDLIFSRFNQLIDCIKGNLVW